jgi:hypothetical protein
LIKSYENKGGNFMTNYQFLLIALIAYLVPSLSQAGTGKYLCKTATETGFEESFEVTEETQEAHDANFRCGITVLESKKVFYCHQYKPEWDYMPANPISFIVNFGSNLRFSGQKGMRPDSHNGSITPRNTRVSCVFSN